MLVIRTKSDGLVEVAPDDVVSVRELSHAPVRTSQIRALEHAAALAWPGTEQQLAGRLAAAGRPRRHQPRQFSCATRLFSAICTLCRTIVDWYRARGLPAWLALPERLLPVRAAGIKQTRVMVRDVTDADRRGPTSTWHRFPTRRGWRSTNATSRSEVLTAVVDGEVVFAAVAGVAVGRGAVTTAPDGTRWVGISSVRVATDASPARPRPPAVRRTAGVGRRTGRTPGVRRGARRQHRRDHAVRVDGFPAAPQPPVRRSRVAAGSSLTLTIEPMRLATWNVNSIRTRVDRVADWLERADVDVLAMQETKCTDAQFPTMPFAALGYEVAHVGLNQWNGVAIASRVGLDDIEVGFEGQPTWSSKPDVEAAAEARALGATCGGVRVWSLYMPNGRTLDDPHYSYKLDWLAALRDTAAGWLKDDPRRTDRPGRRLEHRTHRRGRLGHDRLRRAGRTCRSPSARRSTRSSTPNSPTWYGLSRPGPGIYTYWDYTQLAFQKRRGMRIDFILGSPGLAGAGDARRDRQGRTPSRQEGHHRAQRSRAGLVELTG